MTESRAPLREAAQSFDALGLLRFAERARRELRASGETPRRRVPGAWAQLTPQELQIAQLAAEGLSNREIGERLYLSHRTVGSHLYRLLSEGWRHFARAVARRAGTAQPRLNEAQLQSSDVSDWG
jgi:DNA-binding CsgD family transcriptional regulator